MPWELYPATWPCLKFLGLQADTLPIKPLFFFLWWHLSSLSQSPEMLNFQGVPIKPPIFFMLLPAMVVLYCIRLSTVRDMLYYYCRRFGNKLYSLFGCTFKHLYVGRGIDGQTKVTRAIDGRTKDVKSVKIKCKKYFWTVTCRTWQKWLLLKSFIYCISNPPKQVGRWQI